MLKHMLHVKAVSCFLNLIQDILNSKPIQQFRSDAVMMLGNESSWRLIGDQFHNRLLCPSWQEHLSGTNIWQFGLLSLKHTWFGEGEVADMSLLFGQKWMISFLICLWFAESFRPTSADHGSQRALDAQGQAQGKSCGESTLCGSEQDLLYSREK